MFNFDFFSPGKYNTRVPETPLWSSNTQKTDMSESLYTVSVDNDGRTVLNVSCNGLTITLTLNERAAKQLIRLLEATLPEHSDEEDSQHNDTAESNGSR